MNNIYLTVPYPCDVVGCSEKGIVCIQVVADDVEHCITLCPACVKEMSELNSRITGFFTQKPDALEEK